jgi:hypothetical protein
MLRDATTTFDAGSLRARLTGSFVLPSDPDWDHARQAWNLAVDQRPAAVAIPESVEDVIAVVRFARERGLRVAAQGTGHNACAIETLEDTVLLKTSAMRGVEIDADGRRARVQAGALWADVAVPASEAGLAALAGSSHDVGVVGYSLGGGLSWLARKHGLAANSILAVELVTPDGRLVRADADHEPDLFWAIRGGGGNFGVVTALELRLFPVERVYAGMVAFPWERATEVLQTWREWTDTVPDEVTSSGRILQFPPLPDIPEPLRGRKLVVVEVAYLGDEAEGDRIIAPLRALGPEMDTFAMITPAELLQLHMDPPAPVPGRGGHVMLGGLSAEAIDAFVAVAGPGSGSTLLSVELRQLGGALARPAVNAGALDSFDGRFALFGVGIAMGPEAVAAIEATLADVRRTLAMWTAGRPYLNFAEEPTDTRTAYPAETYERLQAIRAAHDPDEVMVANHPIPASA